MFIIVPAIQIALDVKAMVVVGAIIVWMAVEASMIILWSTEKNEHGREHLHMFCYAYSGEHDAGDCVNALINMNNEMERLGLGRPYLYATNQDSGRFIYE